MTTKRGGISEPEKKVVAARQAWKCADCKSLLPACYQIDHIVALVDGGPDSIDNAQALCPNCHATKTQLEHIARVKKSALKSKEDMYETREDIYITKTTVMCTLCKRRRPHTSDHEICLAIEDPALLARALQTKLCKYSFAPRFYAQN